MKFTRIAISICCALLLSVSALAQGFSVSSSAPSQVAHFKPEQIRAFAQKVERTLADTGARVAIIARMGRPASELPEGMHFTHVAFAVRGEPSVAMPSKTCTSSTITLM